MENLHWYSYSVQF